VREELRKRPRMPRQKRAVSLLDFARINVWAHIAMLQCVGPHCDVTQQYGVVCQPTIVAQHVANSPRKLEVLARAFDPASFSWLPADSSPCSPLSPPAPPALLGVSLPAVCVAGSHKCACHARSRAWLHGKPGRLHTGTLVQQKVVHYSWMDMKAMTRSCEAICAIKQERPQLV
jgi:hypothetical protein